jgi:hypothetical protein
MMEDKLKKYINNNKGEFDSLDVSNDLWAKIERELPTSRLITPRFQALKIAAIIILILGGSLVGYIIGGAQNSEDSALNEKTQLQHNLAFEGMSEELVEVERYYINEVIYRENQIDKDEIDEDLLLEIELLKEEFESLKIELSKSIDPMKVIEAMVENYQQRIDLLQSILNQLNKEREELKEMKNENIA